MKRFSQQLNTKAKELKLSVAEKRDLRDRLVSYMEYHPVGAQVTTHTVSVADETYSIFKFDASRFLKLAGVFVFIFTLSVSALAEKAVPGDTLYAVKIGFNEELRSTLVQGSYDKVVWETQLINRRIAEVRLLADTGRLTEEVEAQMASAVKEHSDNARQEIQNLKLIDKDEAALASIKLTTALDVQSTALRNRSEITLTGQSTDLIETVLEESQVVEDSNLPAYDKLSARVESETIRAHELLLGVAKVATAEEQVDIKRRLDDIDIKIITASGLLEQNEIAARQGLVEALQQTHRLIVFMTNIDVRASVTVDEIVPVTLTAEEKVALAKAQLEKSDILRLQILDLLQGTSTVAIEAALLEKIIPALEQSSTSAAEAKSLLQIEPIDEPLVTSLSLQAYNLVNDILGLLTAANVPVVFTSESATTTPPIIEERDVLEDGEEVIGTTSSEVPESVVDSI